MSDIEQVYKLEIRDTDQDSITFTPRIFGEVGKDIVAIKLSLGTLVDIAGVISQGPNASSDRTQPLDPNGWFDCTNGQQVSIEQAATFDSKMQTALTNFQLKNQFLIISYLFNKYAVPGIVNSVGENYNSNSEQDQARYLATALSQLESVDLLFESEIGNLGEATIAVMHGWVPHTSAGNTNYYHTRALLDSLDTNTSTIVDVVPYEILRLLVEGHMGQTVEDLQNAGLIDDFSRAPLSSSGRYLEDYLKSVPEASRWIGSDGIPNFEYGYVTYNTISDQENSSLYNSTITTIKNYKGKSLDERVVSQEEKLGRLRRVFYPDPFSTEDPFYISQNITGLYFETDFVLDSQGPLPTTEEEVIKQIEESALDHMLSLTNKPRLWFLPVADALTMKAWFGEDEKIAPPHNGQFPDFSNRSSDQTKRQIPRFSEIWEKIESTKKDLNLLPETAFGAAQDYIQARRNVLLSNLESLENDFAQEPTLEEKKQNFIVLGTQESISENTPPGSEELDPPCAASWRSLENFGSEPPLVRFIEYKTPTLRPGQRYRAMLEFSTRKLDSIISGVLPTVEQPEGSNTPDANDEDLCVTGDTDETLRTLEEYRVHARKKRREVVRQLREEFKQEPALRGSNNITRGQVGPFDLNRALNQLMGFDINGASDYEYTKGVLSRLGDVGAAAMEKLGMLDTDIDYFNSIANDTNKELTKKDAKGKPQKNVIEITLEELEERTNTIVKDLQESSEIVSSEGIAFKKGSSFNASKESGLVKQFYTQMKDLVLSAAGEHYGQSVAQAMSANPDKAKVAMQFEVTTSKGPNPHMGPDFGKKIVAFGIALPEKFKIKGKLWPYAEKPSDKIPGGTIMPNFLQKGYSKPEKIKLYRGKIKNSKSLGRPRTVNYISNIYEMTGLLTDKPNEIISVFDDGRGSCKDLGINLDKKLASSYVANFTTGVQVEHPPGAPSGFSWKKFGKDNFADPAKDWAKTSAKNWENSWNDTFDEQEALQMLGDMCTLEDLYREFFDKLDLVSLLCDWLKCIRLPNFNLKLPSFYLPPLPSIPILGWYGAVIKFFMENLKQILIRIICTFVRTIIDKLAIPFCEEQLREFMAAGSLSGSPIMDEALAEALLNTGVPKEKKEQAKTFFDDVASITTGQELCHLLTGKSLDAATMKMIQRLLEKNDLQGDLDTQESLMNYFDLLGTFLPDGLCEELQNSTSLPVPKDCLEISGYLHSIRNRLQTGDGSLSDEEIEEVLQMAKEEMNNRKSDLEAFSGNNIGSLLPEAYAPGNPDAIISSYPDFLKERIDQTAKDSFTAARMDYINAMDSYIPSLSIAAPATPRAGTDRYNDIQNLEFEAATTQLALYSQGVHSSRIFAQRNTLKKLGLPPEATAEELEEIRNKGIILHNLAKALKSWISRSQNQSSAYAREFGGDSLGYIRGALNRAPKDNYVPAMGPNFHQHIEFLDKVLLTSTDGTREGNTMYSKSNETRQDPNPFFGDENEEIREKITNLVNALRVQFDSGAAYNLYGRGWENDRVDPALAWLDFRFNLHIGEAALFSPGGESIPDPLGQQGAWSQLGIEPFDLTYEQLSFISALTMPKYNPNYYARGGRTEHGGHMENTFENLHHIGENYEPSIFGVFNAFDELVTRFVALETLKIEIGEKLYYANWKNENTGSRYADRISTAALDREPDWLGQFRWTDDGTNWWNPFLENMKQYRSVNLDETIEAMRALLKEYISKTGYFPDEVVKLGEDISYDEFLTEMRNQWGPTYSDKSNVLDKYCWGGSAWSKNFIASKGDRVWENDWSVYDKYRGKFFEESDEQYGERSVSAWLWNPNYNGDDGNYTEKEFVDNWIGAALKTEREGLEWNHELRSRKVLDAIILLTDPVRDPYSAAVRSMDEIGGVSWYNTLLLFSVFETESVPFDDDLDKTHKVFKRAKLPNRRGEDQREEWNPYKQFVSYYRRIPTEGTVHDYVQGDRTFNYVSVGSLDVPTFIQKGAVYDNVFNKIIERDPYPIETYYTPYRAFHESFNDPLDKSEYAMIVPAFVSSAEMTSDFMVEKLITELTRTDEARIRKAFDASLSAAAEVVDFITFGAVRREIRRARDREIDRSAARIRTEQENLRDTIEAQQAFAVAAINQVEDEQRAKYLRNYPSNHPERQALDAKWTGSDPTSTHAVDIFLSLQRIIETNATLNEDEDYLGNLLINVMALMGDIIRHSPHNAYEALRNLSDGDAGLYKVLDPVNEVDEMVPIFPLSMQNAAIEPSKWMQHTYDTLTSMALVVHGGVPDFFEHEINQPLRDANKEVLTNEELMARFVDWRLQGSQAAKTITQICTSLANSTNNPNLIKFTTDRVKHLSDIVTRGIEYRPNFVTERHLLMLDKVLRDTVLFKSDRAKLDLGVQFGQYHPQISMEEIPAEKQFDRYNITIKSDFHLRMSNQNIEPKSFRMCEFLPPSLVSNNESGIVEASFDLPGGARGELYFSKRESFAEMAATALRSAGVEGNISSLKDLLYEDIYINIRDSIFSNFTSMISRSRLFDLEYAQTIDARLSAEPIYQEECVKNRYGLVESAVLSYNKTIINTAYDEIMKEMSDPKNSPFNRDFDDPHPLELALQSISLKAFVRVCLVDTLFKGGLAYSIWDIEPVVSEQIFKDYVYEHVFRELTSSRFFASKWKQIIERTVGITNPTAALKKLLELEMVKLPDYSKQVFNFSAKDKEKDYYNWISRHSEVIPYNRDRFTSNIFYINTRQRIENLPESSVARAFAESLEDIEGEDIDYMSIPAGEMPHGDGLVMENYIRLSGELAERAHEIWTEMFSEVPAGEETLYTRPDGSGREFHQVFFAVETLHQRGVANFDPTHGQWANERGLNPTIEMLNWCGTHLRFSGFGTGRFDRGELREGFEIREGESLVVSPDDFDMYLAFLCYCLPRRAFEDLINNSTIHHGARISAITRNKQIIDQLALAPDIRRKSFLEKAFLLVLRSHGRDDEENPIELPEWQIAKLPLANYEHELKLEDCGYPSGNLFADEQILLNPGRLGRLTTSVGNSRRPIHTDYVTNALFDSQSYKNVTEHIFPLRRFLAINSIFATSMISGYNGMPTLFDSVKTSIAFVAGVASTPSSQQTNLIQVTPEQFMSTVQKNWPSHPHSADCFDFPLPGGEFFKKFIEDLWKLIKQLPSILFRGVANQLDPAYKEMRQHYLNCDINNLTWDGIRIFSADAPKSQGLVNGLYFPDGNIEFNKGKGKASYVPVVPSIILDYQASLAHLMIGEAEPLGRTVARTITYAFNGMAPFFDLSMAFQVPCAGINEDWWDDAKFDIGEWGRYGHPLSPFTILALSTPQLESDKKLKRPNCVEGRENLAKLDECDE